MVVFSDGRSGVLRYITTIPLRLHITTLIIADPVLLPVVVFPGDSVNYDYPFTIPIYDVDDCVLFVVDGDYGDSPLRC